MRVAVGSLNPSKVDAVKRAYSILGIEAEVIPVKPPPLPRQPMGLESIIDGAFTRARWALGMVNADEAVGIEAGVVDVRGYSINIVAASVFDGAEYTIGIGPSFMIPQAFAKEIQAGRELEEVVDSYYGTVNVGEGEGFIGLLTRGIVKRIDLNTQAVLMALVPRLKWNRGLYERK